MCYSLDNIVIFIPQILKLKAFALFYLNNANEQTIFISTNGISIPGITKYQADNFYINNEEHATFTDNIDMNNHKITNLNDGTNDKDAVNKKQLNALSLIN